MGVGVSVFLVAVGAILAFAVQITNSHGIDINTVGVILMVVGGIGLMIALAFVGLGDGGWGWPMGYRRRTYIDDSMPVGGRRYVRREIIE